MTARRQPNGAAAPLNGTPHPVNGTRPPRAILFDWDNTLVDSWATIHEALNFLMRAMDKPEWTLADTKGKVRLSLREAFPMHFGERWEEALSRNDLAPQQRAGLVADHAKKDALASERAQHRLAPR